MATRPATFFVGEVSERAKFVTDVAKRAMEKGIEAITPGGTTGDIGFAINKFVTKNGLYAVREMAVTELVATSTKILSFRLTVKKAAAIFYVPEARSRSNPW